MHAGDGSVSFTRGINVGSEANSCSSHSDEQTSNIAHYIACSDHHQHPHCLEESGDHSTGTTQIVNPFMSNPPDGTCAAEADLALDNPNMEAVSPIEKSMYSHESSGAWAEEEAPKDRCEPTPVLSHDEQDESGTFPSCGARACDIKQPQFNRLYNPGNPDMGKPLTDTSEPQPPGYEQTMGIPPRKPETISSEAQHGTGKSKANSLHATKHSTVCVLQQPFEETFHDNGNSMHGSNHQNNSTITTSNNDEHPPEFLLLHDEQDVAKVTAGPGTLPGSGARACDYEQSQPNSLHSPANPTIRYKVGICCAKNDATQARQFKVSKLPPVEEVDMPAHEGQQGIGSSRYKNSHQQNDSTVSTSSISEPTPEALKLHDGQDVVMIAGPNIFPNSSVCVQFIQQIIAMEPQHSDQVQPPPQSWPPPPQAQPPPQAWSRSPPVQPRTLPQLPPQTQQPPSPEVWQIPVQESEEGRKKLTQLSLCLNHP